MNALVLALLIALFAVFLAYYYFAAMVQAASKPPQEPSVLCAVAAARNATAATGHCVYNGTHVIYLS